MLQEGFPFVLFPIGVLLLFIAKQHFDEENIVKSAPYILFGSACIVLAIQ